MMQSEPQENRRIKQWKFFLAECDWWKGTPRDRGSVVSLVGGKLNALLLRFADRQAGALRLAGWQFIGIVDIAGRGIQPRH